MVITPMVHLANDHPITWQPMEQQPACWLQHVLHLAIWRRFGDCGLEKNRGRSWKCFTYGATATNSGRSAPMAWFPSVGLHQTWPGDLVPALLPINFMKCRPPVTRCGKLGTFFSHDTQLATGWVAWQTPEIWVTVSWVNLCLLESSSYLSKI